MDNKIPTLKASALNDRARSERLKTKSSASRDADAINGGVTWKPGVIRRYRSADRKINLTASLGCKLDKRNSSENPDKK